MLPDLDIMFPEMDMYRVLSIYISFARSQTGPVHDLTRAMVYIEVAYSASNGFF